MESFSEDVILARKGDTAAFSRLYAMVYKDLYHIALYCLGDPHDASDAVSDTVLDAFCTIGRLRDETAFRSWIMRILSAKIKRRQKENINKAVELDETMNGEFDYDTVELRHALDSLDSHSRLILSMSVTGGYSGKEIADVCGISEGTVRSQLSRIRKKLRMSLEY